MEKAYPAWAERQRYALRQATALGQPIEKLNLPYLQGDLAEENRATKPNAGQSHGQGHDQSHGHERDQGQGKRLNKSDKPYYNRPKKGKKLKQTPNSNTKPPGGSSKSNYGTSNETENQVHSFFMGTYSLGLNSTGSEGESSDSDSSVESDPFFHENKLDRRQNRPRATRPKNSAKSNGKKPCQHRFDALLYDTGSTDHIINDRKWFVDFDPSKENLPVLKTGGGPVIPQGRGKALFRVKAKRNKGYFITCNDQALQATDNLQNGELPHG